MDIGSNCKRNIISSWGWTNKKHLCFLNSIEASFVRNMYQTNSPDPIHLPIWAADRRLDSSEEVTSGLTTVVDVHNTQRRRYSTTSSGESCSMAGPKRNKKLCSTDQVVPNIHKTKENNEMEKRYC